MIKRMFALSLCLFVICANAEVDVNSGNFFKDVCALDEESNNSRCLFWVAGVHSGIATGMLIAGIPSEKLDSTSGICFPNGVMNNQLKAVFTKYLDDHPESLHEVADQLALVSWMDAWPCPKSQ